MFHVKHGWSELGRSIGISLTARQISSLERYEALLVDRALPRGMVAENDRARLRIRHLADSLRAASLIPVDADVLDLGSGAGLPGVPLAIGCPAARFVLVEPRRNRAAFLELVLDDLRLPNASVIHGRIESLSDGCCDVVVARAFDDAAGCWARASRHLRPGGCVVYWAGREARLVPPSEDLAVTTVPPPAELADAGPLVIMSAQ
jgi:16S rRNA (guanine527-N7)-methyltransferase